MLKRCLIGAIAAVFHIVIAFFFTPPVWANPVQTPRVQAQLVSEVQSVQPGTPFWVGLHFQIQPGWHTYWQNPGDSGTSPALKWTLPAGFEAGDLVYPYPKRLAVGPLMNFGYKDTVMLLAQLTPPSQLSTATIQLRAQADWLVCQVDCIPETANLNLTLPVAAQPPALNGQWQQVFAQTRQALPQPSPWETTATIDGETVLLRIKTPQLQPSQVKLVEFFPDEDGIITNAAAQTSSFDAEGLVLKLQRGNRSQFERVNGVLVLQQADQRAVAESFTIQAAVDSNPASATPAPTILPLWQVMLLALMGGVVLNIMPCVFPVLFLKAFNIVQHSTNRQRVRWGAIAFTAGVLVSFAVVASTLLILRGFGQQIGWGFQLQSPAFVMLMAYLMFAVGLSFSGVFIFGASLMGIGQKLTAHSGYAGEFFTGVLATVVATPCTAPFMATAIGVALTQPTWVAIAIFELLGLGLALPYLVLSLIPAVQRLLPKPGAWMETCSQLLAFPMYAATAWLVWVLTQQTGTTGLATVLTGLILIGFAAWLHQKTRLVSRWRQQIGMITALVVVGFALTLTQLPTPVTQATNPSDSKLVWQPYTPEALTTLRKSGQPVFVNFTAAWCITCQVNEQVAFNQPETIAAFQAKNVTLLKADWTNRNPVITKALESFGRSGVPLYLLYPASTTKPTILPQLLSPQEVQNAIKKL